MREPSSRFYESVPRVPSTSLSGKLKKKKMKKEYWKERMRTWRRWRCRKRKRGKEKRKGREKRKRRKEKEKSKK